MPVEGLCPALRRSRKSLINSEARSIHVVACRSDAASQSDLWRHGSPTFRLWFRVHTHTGWKHRMSLLDINIDSQSSPLAVVEEIAASNDLAFERSGEDEITIVYKGRFTDYQLSFTWMAEIDALHLACAFDMKIPTGRRSEVQRLIAMINEQMWIGHFDLWTQSGMT